MLLLVCLGNASSLRKLPAPNISNKRSVNWLCPWKILKAYSSIYKVNGKWPSTPAYRFNCSLNFALVVWMSEKGSRSALGFRALNEGWDMLFGQLFWAGWKVDDLLWPICDGLDEPELRSRLVNHGTHCFFCHIRKIVVKVLFTWVNQRVLLIGRCKAEAGEGRAAHLNMF